MKIAILGGGYTGMSIAKKLVNENNNITIFEKDQNVGGMVRTEKIQGENLENYYRHIFKSDKETIKLINEFELEKELIWPSTKMGYLTTKSIYEFGTPISLLKFADLSFIDKIRFGFNIIHLKLINDYKKIEKYTAEEWLLKRIGKNAYKKIWEPLLIGKFGDEKNKVSMAWLWGKVKLRSTSSDKDGEKLGYIKGSYQKLTDAFYNSLIDKNVKIKLNSNVNEIKKNEGKYTIYFNDQADENFDVVVSTLDYRSNEILLKEFMDDDEMKKSKLVRYTAARTTIIVSDKSFSKYYWLNIGDNSIPFGGIIEHTNFINKNNYNNKNIIYISNYMSEENKMYNMTKDELFKESMKYLNKINPNFTMDDVIEYHVYDEKYAQPIIECNYSKNILNSKLKNENMFICTMPQIYPEDRGMNYAIKYGYKLANEIKNIVNI